MVAPLLKKKCGLYLCDIQTKYKQKYYNELCMFVYHLAANCTDADCQNLEDFILNKNKGKRDCFSLVVYLISKNCFNFVAIF